VFENLCLSNEIGESDGEVADFGSFRSIQSGKRNGQSAQRTAARDRAFAKPPAQRIDRRLRCRTSWRYGIGQITLIRG
jgi:hypothetical protein